MRLELAAVVLWVSLCPSLHAGSWHKARIVAQTVLAASIVADLASSSGLYELNPAVRGRFGLKQAGILGGVGAARLQNIVAQCWMAHRSPSHERLYTVTDFAAAGVHGTMAVRNFRLR